MPTSNGEGQSELILTKPIDDREGKSADLESIRNFFAAFADALNRGDGQAMAGMFALPGFVIGEGVADAFTEADQIAAFYRGASEQYRRMGVIGTRPEIQQIEQLTRSLLLVRIYWPYLFEDGREEPGEDSRYVLQFEAGVLQLRSALMQGRRAH